MRELTWLFFRITCLEQGFLVLAWNMFHTEIPKLCSSHSLEVLQISTVQKLYLECRFSVVLIIALLEIFVFSWLLWKFSARPWFSTTRASLRMCGCAFLGTVCAKMATVGVLWKIGEKLTVLGDNND